MLDQDAVMYSCTCSLHVWHMTYAGQIGDKRASGTSRIRFIHYSIQIPCSSNVLWSFLVVWRFFESSDVWTVPSNSIIWIPQSFWDSGRRQGDGRRRAPPHGAQLGTRYAILSTANLRTKIPDFGGFDSSRILVLRGWNCHVHREYPGSFESVDLSRDNLSRQGEWAYVASVYILYNYM